MKLLIAVTHLLGTGHLSRALALAEAFSARGWRVDVASGGRPAPHLETGNATLHQLPPLASDGADFATLLGTDGRPADAGLFAARQAMLTGLLDSRQPDVLITELFPFGRRALATEFDALLERARGLPQPPLTLASVRDILAPPSKPKRVAETEQRLLRFYDGVLVHSDPALIPLEDSWPLTPAMKPLLRYTGFVVPPPPVPDDGTDGQGEILVTAGGGPVGRPVFEAAALCAASAALPQRWRLLVAKGDAALADRLRVLAPPDRLLVEPVRPDFRALLGRAAASLGRCGYNTALDCLTAGVPSVFCPFEDGKEVEQTIRATILARQPGIATLREADLTPDSLAKALQSVLGARIPPLSPNALAGATRSVEIVEALLTEKTS
ncbi:putative glycosyltransferase [Azospirillum lipoferum]|uniref:Glycosyltransferase n=1 Tax=Azospirillum lipoferum TaxID=193 RepID=A0A5A9GSH5_AZOLI|nr:MULTISPECIES: glycosyltransferase [Azospirillum]KAA0596735.1 glycosyltransferase [Azospirillum lipoferum]MCP1610757.1 putative glycosyltransferase [Azospirillum lipoferum]MDW5537798.1 glycosyltransferase [Azospirillum sp. NL1]